MEYIIKILADLFKPTKLQLPSFGFTKLQPVYVKNTNEFNHKKY